MVWFPFEYHDIGRWKEDGLELSTTSNEAAKLLDATLTQMIFHENDPYVESIEKSSAKMIEADPDFVMGHCFNLLSETIHGLDPVQNQATIKKIYDLQERTKKNPAVTPWEREHVKAVVCLATEDLDGCTKILDDILVEYPKDMIALHFGFFSHLMTGTRTGMRNLPYRVKDYYKPKDRFFGNVHGKICFGFEECNQFDLAMKEGSIALEHTPNDIWAIHSISHVYHETRRHREGLKFMEEKENNWKPRSTFTQHLWWHKALHYIDLGQFENALSIFDQTLKPVGLQGNEAFPLSDAASLLLRLEMEDNIPSLKDRWREIGQGFLELTNSATHLFYDFHTLFALYFSDNKEAAGKIKQKIHEFAVDENRSGRNKETFTKVGIPFTNGIVEYAEGNYDQAVELMNPIKYDIEKVLGFSRAQADIVNLMLVDAAVKAKRNNLAKQLIEQRMAHNIEVEPGFNSRMLKKVL